MTAVMLVGDLHVMDRAPRNATESYTDDIIDMLTWIADECDRRDIDYCVWAGDIFHFKQPSKTSHALVLRMISVVKYFQSKGVQVLIVTGNHDISNDVLASVREKQPLGVLYEAGAQELVGWHEKIPVYGVPWRSDWTTYEKSAWEAFKDWREADSDTFSLPALAVTHAPIYPPKEAENIQWELVPTMGDNGISRAMDNEGFLYYGHIHEDHGIFEVEGVTYANMGALSRGSLTEYNVQRQIKVAVWTDGADEDSVLGGNPPGFEEIVVPHKPASEVLRVAEVAEEKADKLSLDVFLSEVGHSSLDISTTASVIDHIRTREDVDDRIKKTAIEILEDVS